MAKTDCTRTYVNNTEVVTKPKTVTSNCNSICFVNQGDMPALVNGFVLNQNQGLCFDGDEGECDVTNYTVSFDTNTGTTRKLFVFRKFNNNAPNTPSGAYNKNC